MSGVTTDRPLRPVTEDEIATFERDGVVCLRGVLPESWLTRMHDAVEVALGYSTNLSEMARSLGGAARAARASGSAAGGDGTATDPKSAGTAASGGSFVAGTDHWRQQPEFRAFATASPLPAIAAALMRATKVNLYEDSLLVKEPGSVEPTEFHQDLAYFHVEGEQVCTVWCPLDPTTRATGAVGYVRGSHRWRRMFKPNLFVSTLAIPGTEGDDVPDVAAEPDTYDVAYFETGPGDVTVHHARTVHGAGPNTSTTTRRRAISVRYCGDDARYLLRPGAPRKPHHARVQNGDVLDCEECPVVWRAG